MVTKKFTFFLFFFTFLLFFSSNTFAQKTNIDGLYHYKLDNGLELFVAENNSAPLAYVEIAVRAGAVTQTPETAGLFHLYEHMMFKGNQKYENQKAVTEALNGFGVSDWNGSTGIDRVNYYFTIPSAQVEKGLEFWSHAIRTPKIDEKELENEKGVVLSEINGNLSEPSRILFAHLSNRMFNKFPWTVDSGGNPDAIKNATREQLLEIQKKFYVPNNSAIFVGGDVNHEKIFEYTKKIYSDWKKSDQVQAVEIFSMNPLSSVEKYVYANPGAGDQFINVSYYLRGPDGEKISPGIYAGDIWANIIDDPSGLYVKTLTDTNLDIPNADYIGGYYVTRRTSSLIAMLAVMLNTKNPAEKCDEFLKTIQNELVPKMKSENFCENLSSTKRKIQDSKIYETETAEGILSNISFCWSNCGSDFYFGYEDEILKVQPSDVRDFISDYMEGKNGMLIVNVSKKVFEDNRENFLKAGYEEITADNSFWWKQGN